MSTPALDRAKRELGNEWTNEQAQTIARDVVYAALHDPDGDVIARTLIEHTRTSGIHGDCSCGHVVPLGHSFASHQADAVRAAILGEAGRRRDTAEPGERRRKPPEPMPTKTRIIQGFGI